MGQFAIPIALGGQLLGAGLSYGENRAANARSRQAAQSAAEIGAEGNPANPFITSQLNSGQDSFLQFLRSNPQGLQPFQFDTSGEFKALSAQDALNTQTQVNQLRAGAGSLGERFGAGFAQRETNLRSQIATNIAARNAGISQSSFNTALQAGLSDFQGAQSNRLGLLQLLSGNTNTAKAQQLQALELSTSLPYPGFGSTISDMGGNIGQLLLLSQYLRQPGGRVQPLPGAGTGNADVYSGGQIP